MPSLEELDLLRDEGISRGIGTSPLLSQRIQRRNIEDLRNLGSAVAESRATLDAERERRLREAQSAFAKNRGGFVSGGRAGGVNPNAPTAVITVAGPGAVVPNAPAGSFNTKPVFGLNFIDPTTGRQNETRSFGSLQELQSYVDSTPGLRGVNLVTAGISDQLTGQDVRLLDQLGVSRLSVDAARELSGIRPGRMPGDPGIADIQPPQEFAKLTPTEPFRNYNQLVESVRSTKFDAATLSSNERARLTGGVGESLITAARNPKHSPSDLVRLQIYQKKLQQGQGFEIAQALLRGGKV